MDKKLILSLMVLAVVGIALLYSASQGKLEDKGLKRFSSYAELDSFLKEQQNQAGGRDRVFAERLGVASAKTATTASPSTQGAADYSTTNIQVAGVDEADIVKNDGKYIYAVSGNKLVIVDAYPAENARVLSTIEMDDYSQPTEIFVNKDRLVVFSPYYEYYEESILYDMPVNTIMPRGYYSDYTRILVYDIRNREKPELARNITVSGNYYDSRMIGEYVYAVVNMPVYYYDKQPVPLPVIMENGKETKITASNIYYFDVLPDYSYNFVNVIALNVQDDREDYNSKTYLAGQAQNMFVSQNNIYMSHTNYPEIIMRPDVFRPVRDVLPRQESTTINKIEISNGKTDYKGKATVPGTVLNQFSMDEHKGYFRIATTTGEVWGRGSQTATAKNNIYVLDEGMKLVGKVEDLAPGEKIYSARFMGDRAYLVTFKKTDPLFVIDLQDPYNPQVLGKLKIPGYSDYLHPYDENHIIGIGKEAIEAEEGDFAWYQGIKLALFDVSDPENPKEISKFSIGDRGTDSEALHDHKAFLFDRKKNLLVMPILLAEIDKSKYAGGEVPLYAYGDFTWQGAYVFGLDTEKGFELKGMVSHVDDDSLKKSGYYYYSSYSVKRSLYIGNVLYTVSDGMIKANGLGDMEEVNKVKMPYSGYDYEGDVVEKTVAVASTTTVTQVATK